MTVAPFVLIVGRRLADSENRIFGVSDAQRDHLCRDTARIRR